MVSGGEQYSSHPAETRFSSTHYARLTHLPLFGADPTEESLDAGYGAAESWTYLPGAKGMIVKMRIPAMPPRHTDLMPPGIPG